MKRKLIVSLLAIVGLVGLGAYFFIFIKPKYFKEDKVANEQAIVVTAVDLVKQFVINDSIANAKYGGKVVEVTGIVAETGKDQDGATTVTLKSDDPFSNVFFTLKENTTGIQGGSTITIKGLCDGILSDVKVRDAIIVK